MSGGIDETLTAGVPGIGWGARGSSGCGRSWWGRWVAVGFLVGSLAVGVSQVRGLAVAFTVVWVAVVVAVLVSGWWRGVSWDVWLGSVVAVLIPVLVASHASGYSGGYRECILDPGSLSPRVVVVEVGERCGVGETVEPSAGFYEVAKVGARWYRYVPEAESEERGRVPDGPADGGWRIAGMVYVWNVAAVLAVGVLAVRQRRRKRTVSRDPVHVAAGLATREPAVPEECRGPDFGVAFMPGPGSVGPVWRVMVRLIGEPDVIGCDGRSADWVLLDAAGVRKARALEVLAWAVTHRGASREALVDAVWSGAASVSTVDNNLSAARRVCAEVGGRDVEWLPVSGGRLRVDPTVVSDLELMEATLAWEVTVTDPGTARHGLEQVARLITGRPGDGTGRWRWFDLEGLERQVRDRVVEVSLALARRCIEAGDPAGAVAATQIALSVDPTGDEVVMARLRALALTGDRAGFDETHRGYLRHCQLLEHPPTVDVTDLAVKLRPPA